jgi:tetratricopeptide (TPR) repeat protein
MAQQTEPVKRAVAVKVIKAGMDSREVLVRFEAERQALAMMDHPNIAKVLDAGTTEGGRPFFVMELVKGTPITRYCDEHKLTPHQRLELFVPVCQAIQHAHQKGIIHRDIKPSNVLVAMYDDRPVPKVIDFGVAKAAGQSLTDKTLMTGFGAIVGTAEYMSPEQASLNNLDIDTRSDVYSLGVLLYELLTGTTPVDRKSLGKAAILEILRIVREVEVLRPSAKLSTLDALPSVAANRGTEPAKLSRLMRGELDWLVLKALEKDRTRRYETANALGRDIQRYLANEVVEARPPSAAYRVRKFVSRHRSQVMAVGLVLLAILAGLMAVVVVQTKANAEIARALVRETEANRALGVANESLAATNEELTRSKAAVQARYDLALEAIKTFHTGVSEDFLLKPEGFAALRGKLLGQAVEFYRKLGQLDDHTDREARRLGYSEQGELELAAGRPAVARELFEKALEQQRRLAEAAPSDPTVRAGMASVVRQLGTALQASGRPADAIEHYRRSLAQIESIERLTAVNVYDMACCRALIAGAAAAPGSGLSAAEAEAEATQAVSLLRRAFAAGYGDLAWARDLDTDLKPIRGRSDFQALMAELAHSPKGKKPGS